MRVYYYDETGQYCGQGETYAMVPMATTKQVPEDVPDGKKPVFNTELNDWELVDMPETVPAGE